MARSLKGQGHNHNKTDAMNLADILIRSAATHPTEIAVHGITDFNCTYSALLKRAQGLARTFRTLDALEPGDRILTLLENRSETIELYFAAWLAGLVIVPLDATASAGRIRDIVRDCQPALAVVSHRSSDAFDPVRTGPAVLNVDEPAYSKRIHAGSWTVTQCEPGSLAWLQYSADDAEPVLGVMHSHHSLLSLVNRFQAQVKKVRPGEALFHSTSLAQGAGFYMLPFIAAGGYQLIPDGDRCDTDALGRLLERHLAVTILANNAMVERLVSAAEHWSDNALAGVDSLIACGQPLSCELTDRVHNRFGHRLLSLLGHPECPLGMAVLDLIQHRFASYGDCRDRLTSAGLPMLGIDIRIQGDNGEALPAGAAGQICISGDTVATGYWSDESNGAARFNQGWLMTGDIGYQDETGFLYLTEPTREDLLLVPKEDAAPLRSRTTMLEDSHRAFSQTCMGLSVASG
ncbi:MAG: acyl--CoA ligase [Saccharospirillum sp.]|nr:acyl--CoA ligase [Saccharospirillum sp.]